MLELLAPGFLYSVAKDGLRVFVRLFQRKQPRLSAPEVIAKRQHWKAEIEAKLRERQKKKLGMDVIVRDVTRVNEYPDIKEGKGISSWYRCGLMGTYHRGILLGLSWEMLTAEGEDKWRYPNHKAGEAGDLKVILIGYVPYESIEAINWDHYCPVDGERTLGRHLKRNGFQAFLRGVDLKLAAISGTLSRGGPAYERRKDDILAADGLPALEHVRSARRASSRRPRCTNISVHRAVPCHGLRPTDVPGKPARH